MLKKYDLEDVPALFKLMSHPDVYPYVLFKADTLDDCYYLAGKILEKEAQGKLITRVILNKDNEAIGTINLYDLSPTSGFLNTWIGQPYFGKGYSKSSKEQFFDEVFTSTYIETIYFKIRKTNIRSIKSTIKLPYAKKANESHKEVYNEINKDEEIFDLFIVEKEAYQQYKLKEIEDYENHSIASN